MEGWWWLRRVGAPQGLTGGEWHTLAAAGKPHRLRRGHVMAWAGEGVLLVMRGELRMRCGQQQLPLTTGDIAGLTSRRTCRIEAIGDVALHLFSHDAWLATLARMPCLTQRLLCLLAQRATRVEGCAEPLPPP